MKKHTATLFSGVNNRYCLYHRYSYWKSPPRVHTETPDTLSCVLVSLGSGWRWRWKGVFSSTHLISHWYLWLLNSYIWALWVWGERLMDDTLMKGEFHHIYFLVIHVNLSKMMVFLWNQPKISENDILQFEDKYAIYVLGANKKMKPSNFSRFLPPSPR